MRKRVERDLIAISFVLFSVGTLGCRSSSTLANFGEKRPGEWRALLVNTSCASAENLACARRANFDAIVLAVGGGDLDAEISTARTLLDGGFDLYYWIEVARSPELADANPGWMASVQGHPEWRRLFPSVPEPAPDEVVKVYPWTPILYREVFDAQLIRIDGLLAELPRSKGIFLNDLQGAPSACGCGHALCRWTTDYGPKRTATRLGPDAAARFVREIRERHEGREVIPVWATECEEHDGAKDGACAGVGCYRGACWREYAEQLAPVVELGGRLGVLATYKVLGRDLPVYEREAAWISWALGTFQSLPPKRERAFAAPSSLVAVLQGWDVSDEELRAQIERVLESGTSRYVVSLHTIDPSWSPRIVRVPSSRR